MISLIYALLVWICCAIVLLTTGEVKIMFLGIEIGILIGQIIHLIIFIKEER